MPVQHRIDPVETAFPHHVGLPAAAFLGRAAEEPDGSGMALRQPFGNGDGTGDGAHAEEVMAAGVAVHALDDRLPVGDRVLGHAFDGVVFGHHADDGRPFAVCGDEGGRDAGDALLDAESVVFQILDPGFGTLVFIVARLGEIPDPVLQGIVAVERRVEMPHAGGLHLVRPAGTGSGNKQQQAGRREEGSFHRHLYFRRAKPMMSAPERAQARANQPPQPLANSTGEKVTRAISTGAMYR